MLGRVDRRYSAPHPAGIGGHGGDRRVPRWMRQQRRDGRRMLEAPVDGARRLTLAACHNLRKHHDGAIGTPFRKTAGSSGTGAKTPCPAVIKNR